MLRYALIFFIIALIAALLGFTGVAAGAAEIATITKDPLLLPGAKSEPRSGGAKIQPSPSLKQRAAR